MDTIQIPAGKVPLDYVMYMRDIKTRELAELLGVSSSEVSRMRRGMVPKAELRKKIARRLKLSQAELGWEEPANV